ncbi:uncharacterized protein [Primulina huaijiensis]|uniref:uncharacterized protein isoform X7 n=1 Tax=Primulina huaijiensis TaxID=1492673 RepID=UPI003CC7097D
MVPHSSEIDQNKISAYRDRRFSGTQEEFEEVLLSSTTVYVGNMSFYTTEEQVYELFTRAGEIKKIVMGLDKNSKTPCGFCFVVWWTWWKLLSGATSPPWQRRKTHGFEKVVILMTMRMRRILRSFLRNFRQLVCEFNCLRTYISLLRYKSCGHIPIQVSLAFCNSPSQYLYRRVKVHVSHQYAKGETNSSILQYAGLLQVSSDFFGKKLL